VIIDVAVARFSPLLIGEIGATFVAARRESPLSF
jgi:hypothetical protein